ncbi:hypothetical protein [Timonella senegalensis]|uniref:oxidoreductase n=1 Tax=Timonella senegalensis TaxID=1465825 RepID=UPI002FDD64EE
MTIHPLLTSPARWGTLPLRNRMFMPPMSTHTAHPDGTVSERGHDFIVERARGGAGLIFTESLLTQITYDSYTGYAALISQDKHIEPLSRLVDAVHETGTPIAASLTPGFGRVGAAAPDGGAPYSPSDNTVADNPDMQCRVLTTEQVEDIIEKFAQAVERAMRAGFDAIDIHAHAGHLTDQFLAAAWNRRNDQYGGSVVGRARFATELIKRTRSIVGNEVPISMRLAVRHQFPGGRSESEARELAMILQDAGLNVLIVDAGASESLDWAFPPSSMGTGVFLPDAVVVKPPVTIPVAVTGNLTPDIAERALRERIIDFAGFGRPLIADPQLPAKVAQGLSDRVRPCLRCNLCIDRVFGGQSVECTVNPLVHRAGAGAGAGVGARAVASGGASPDGSAAGGIDDMHEPKRVAVLGAGVRGLETARTLARRGHDVVLYPTQAGLGGAPIEGLSDDLRVEVKRLVMWWEKELARLGVRVVEGSAVANACVTGNEVRRQAEELTTNLTRELGVDEVIVVNDVVVSAAGVGAGAAGPGEAGTAAAGTAGAEEANRLAVEAIAQAIRAGYEAGLEI